MKSEDENSIPLRLRRKRTGVNIHQCRSVFGVYVHVRREVNSPWSLVSTSRRGVKSISSSLWCQHIGGARSQFQAVFWCQRTDGTSSQFPAVFGANKQVGREVNFPQSLVSTNRWDEKSISRSLWCQRTGGTRSQLPGSLWCQ